MTGRRAPVGDARTHAPAVLTVDAEAPHGDHALVWRRHPDVVWRYTGDGVMLLCVGGGDPVLLDGAGALVWEALRVPATAAEVAHLLADRTGADVGDVEAGVHRLLHELAGPFTSGTARD